MSDPNSPSRWSRLGAIAAAILISACAADDERPSGLMRPADLKALTSIPADLRVAYGSDPRQFGELRIPDGPGPHPVVVLVHGGCFKYSDLSDLAPMADALKAEGIASWNIEYRRLADPGGGWPGTFRDVGSAIDHLRALAPAHRLDLGRVVLVGHSAGGHLALWAASRGRLREASPLRSGTPLVPAGVVNLAGPIDLAENIEHYETMCREAVITQLTGGTPATVPERYADAAPNRRLPLGVPQVLVWGEHEDFVPRPLARSHVAAARRAGDQARLVVIPGAGHFEIASPHATSWPRLRIEILALLSVRRSYRNGDRG
jgi:acetyl esterase/lipase